MKVRLLSKFLSHQNPFANFFHPAHPAGNPLPSSNRMSEPPYKRARFPSPPIGTKPPSTTFAHFALQSPSTYSPPTTAPTAFQLPLHLTSFSYSPTREVLLVDRKDESLSVYREPPLGAGVGLGRGYDECTWREETDEGLDALLDT